RDSTSPAQSRSYSARSSCGSTTALASNPCLSAFHLTMLLPAPVLGPVERSALRRFASRCFIDISFPMVSLLSAGSSPRRLNEPSRQTTPSCAQKKGHALVGRACPCVSAGCVSLANCYAARTAKLYHESALSGCCGPDETASPRMR